LSDDGTTAAKAIAHAVALEGALAQADFFITQLRNFAFSLTDRQLKELDVLNQHIARMTGAASLVTNDFYKVIGEGD
jgi:hypothetical protein